MYIFETKEERKVQNSRHPDRIEYFKEELVNTRYKHKILQRITTVAWRMTVVIWYADRNSVVALAA